MWDVYITDSIKASSVGCTHYRQYQGIKCGMYTLQTVSRHQVWDVYITDSIKASTRERRGQGIRRKIAGKNIVPTNWMGFLRDEKNKQELFEFLN